MPAKGSVAVGICLLERLKDTFSIDLSDHRAAGGAQIRGTSGTTLRSVLAEFGETRTFVTEGGRTNRGGPQAAEALLANLAPLHLDECSDDGRREILRSCQEVLVEKIREFHGRRRLHPVYDPAKTTRQFFVDLLQEAAENGKRGPVAQYLVGAKLAMKYPDREIRNDRYSAPDEQAGELGDFVVGDTVLHVTVAPGMLHFAKCTRNLADGYRVYLLVTDDRIAAARQLADQEATGRIAVESVESFLAQNIDERSFFSNEMRPSEVRSFLQVYNERVEAVEADKSIMIVIPQNL